MTLNDALGLVEEICDTIDEIDVDTKARAVDVNFDLEDIREKVVDVGETIEKTGRCTDGQAKALQNWRRGVGGWVR